MTYLLFYYIFMMVATTVSSILSYLSYRLLRTYLKSIKSTVEKK